MKPLNCPTLKNSCLALGHNSYTSPIIANFVLKFQNFRGAFIRSFTVWVVYEWNSAGLLCDVCRLCLTRRSTACRWWCRCWNCKKNAWLVHDGYMLGGMLKMCQWNFIPCFTCRYTSSWSKISRPRPRTKIKLWIKSIKMGWQQTGEFMSLWSKRHSLISHSLSHSNYLLT